MLWKIVISLCLLAQIGEIHLVDGFKLENVHVPKYGLAGGDADLYCYFTVGSDPLYSLKWFKDGQEVYRYMPESERPIHLYYNNGVNVDVEKSNLNRLHLQNLTEATAGMYSCEATTKVSFVTARKEAEMKILVGPSSDPQLKGFPSVATVGDRLDGNCTTHNSKPAAVLSFFINNVKVEDVDLIYYPTKNVTTRGQTLETSTLGLSFVVEQSHLQKLYGGIEIKCVATLIEAFDGMWVKVKIVQESHPNRRKPNSLTSSSSSTSTTRRPYYNTLPESQHLRQPSGSPGTLTHGQSQEPWRVGQQSSMTNRERENDNNYGSNNNCSPGTQILTRIVELIANQNKELEHLSGIQQDRYTLEQESLALRRQELEFLRQLKRTSIRS